MKTTLEEAQEQYQATTDAGFKLFLEKEFGKEALEAPVEPKSWFDLKVLKGAHIGRDSDIHLHNLQAVKAENRNIAPSEEHAWAIRALTMLLQLAQHPFYNGDWKPGWTDKAQTKWKILIDAGEPGVYQGWSSSRPLVFKTKEKAMQFMKTHWNLILEATPVI